MKETIHYAWGRSSLGEFVAASSARGLVALEFAERTRSPASTLTSRYPNTELIEDPARLEEIVEKAVGLIEHPAVGTSIPLDMRGSEFEREVWSALQEIPSGRTVSYLELACRLGSPSLAQKIGEACAANKIAVVIPCHRVLRKNGQLSGYRWGVWRKRTLLEREYLENFSLTSLEGCLV
ncbi:MAG TPA: methylated-DNA--[protein]-cysteine S-methyltransferase [Steroidobacteraceae bacterium]|jgi:AraC family transcriptional regulator of adaptative response/methylated-DNA-[protein]-cysteine methyltransferase|nr:methylated-DNA--[protein]-cysteine S-methyltransferase [Steroidobacteraceae bacterium]